MTSDNLTPPVSHVALIGNFPPRKCGIATFTADLREALATTDSNLKITTVAVTDEGQKHAYPPAVGYEISQLEADDYAAAADHINALVGFQLFQYIGETSTTPATSLWGELVDRAQHLVLPTATLALFAAADLDTIG